VEDGAVVDLGKDVSLCKQKKKRESQEAVVDDRKLVNKVSTIVMQKVEQLLSDVFQADVPGSLQLERGDVRALVQQLSQFESRGRSS
jgi:hypothetical protein